MAAVVAHHALGPAGGARGVEDVERIGGGDRHALVGRLRPHQRLLPQAAPVMIAAVDHRRLGLRPLQYDAGVGLEARQIDRRVEQRLVVHDAAGLEPAAGGQDDFGLGVVDAGRQLLGGEAAEHHRVHGADARAGQHRDHRLRHHRHVEDDAVALLDPEIPQHAGEHLRLGQQAVVGDDALLPGERRIVDDRRLRAAPGHHVAIDRVPAGVADAADEPAPVDAGARVEHAPRRLDPVELGGGLGPESFRVALPAAIDLVVAAGAGIHGAPPFGQRRLPHCEGPCDVCKPRRLDNSAMRQ